jgi:hypothetical protein
MLQAGFQA